jgi:hypothetical protein
MRLLRQPGAGDLVEVVGAGRGEGVGFLDLPGRIGEVELGEAAGAQQVPPGPRERILSVVIGLALVRVAVRGLPPRLIVAGWPC